MLPYVTTLPMDEVRYLLPILRGQAPDDLSLAVHSGLMVADYAAYVTSNTPPFMSESAVELDGPAVANLLDPATPTATAMPWLQIGQFLLPLILEWLRKRQQQ